MKFLRIFYLILFFSTFLNGGTANGHSVHLAATDFNIYWIIPFAGILLSIALIPLFRPAFWHQHYGKVSLFWGLLFLALFSYSFPDYILFYLLEVYLREFLPFILLLLSLFVVSGGILINGDLKGTPRMNFVIILIGTILASIMGTTGASMLLIRPFIRANEWRKNKTHLIVFFIFLVSNIGGSLSPIGDPPLFLGFLRGVSFFWPLQNLLSPMIFVSVILLAIFLIIDNYFYNKELPRKENTNCSISFSIEGKYNFILIGFIVGAVIISGLPSLQYSFFEYKHETIMTYGTFIQLCLLSVITLIAYKITPESIRSRNDFTWEPIKEVAKLFATIFLTMIPAIEMLKGVSNKVGPMKGLYSYIKADDGTNIDSMYFFLTGIISSFLDNAPTYVVFFITAMGPENVDWLMASGKTLMAISCGAVFMGANTYIGNAPNFMVKAIAEENKVKMPSFFGYMAWSFLILMPLFILVNMIYF